MLTPLAGSTAPAQIQIPQAPPPSASSATAPVASIRTAPDTATISTAGQQALHAGGDVDHDGDSH